MSLPYRTDWGAYYEVQCSEEAFFSSAEAVEAASTDVHPRLSEHFAGGTKASLATCGWWDTVPVAANENQPVTSDVPTLILAGTYDPITPPAWSRRVSTDLHDAYYYEFPAGHGVIFYQECAQALAGRFIREPSGKPSLDCLDALQDIW
jgi:pimeloyl-ACP methyl ester carboxylesterase